MADLRVLVYDLETSPNVGYVWGKWDQNVIRFQQEWHLLTVSWKWLGEKKVYVEGLNDYTNYTPGSTDDSSLAWLLHDLFNEADVAVTHNGNSFDQPKARTRMLVHGIPPHSPFKEVDTLKTARKHFAFTSNTLEDLCQQLGLGFKGKPGFAVWLGCMQGDPAAWRKMKRYNRNDVVLLEELYLRLLPWIDEHPNMALIADRPDACPKCLSTAGMTARGWRQNQVTKRRLFRCRACKGYVGGRTIHKSDVQYVP